MKSAMMGLVATLLATVGFCDSSLKGLYKFDDGSGLIAADSSGNGNAATLVNSPEWVSVDGLSCLDFLSSENDSLDFGTALSVTGTTDFSVSFWMKSNVSGVSSLVRQYASADGETPEVIDYLTYLNEEGKLVFSIPNQFSIMTPNAMVDGEWRYITVVREGEKGFVYVNGEKVVSASGEVVNLSGCKTLFGSKNLSDESAYEGLLDELRVYHKALTAEEIEFYANVRGLEFGGDEDGDSLSNGFEFANNMDMRASDSDGDGISDYREVVELKTDPTIHNGDVKEGFELRVIGKVDEHNVTYDKLTDSHSFNVRSGNIADQSDSFVFVSKSLTNNSRLIAKINNFSTLGTKAKVGVMVRDNYSADSKFGFNFISAANGTGVQCRQNSGAFCVKEMAFKNRMKWLSIVHHNGRVSSYVSDVFENGTFHWIKVGEQSVSFDGTVKIGLAVASNNHNKATQLTFSNLEVRESTDLDGDGLTSWEEINVLGTNEIYADTEGDDINDDIELTTGTHPNFAETRIDEKSFHKRGLISKYFKGIYDKLPEFDELPVYATGTVDQLYFPAVQTKIVGSSLSKGAATFSGKLYIDVAGEYKFYTKSNDGSKLYINGVPVVSNGGLHGVRERSGKIMLSAGFHDIKITFFNATGAGTLKMFWSGANFIKQVIPASVLLHSQQDYDAAFDAIDQDGDGLTDKLEATYGSDKNKVDTNGDGLTDFEKYSLGLDAIETDMDNDGISDYDEVKNYLTDPTTIDYDGTVTDLVTLSGAQVSSSSGNWIMHEGVIYSDSLNGSLGYDINVAETGTYWLTVEGTQRNSDSKGDEFSISLYVDDMFVDTKTLNASYGVNGTVSYILPELTAGSHNMTLVWVNVEHNTSLQINTLKLQSVGGPDSDGDGKPDWLENRLEKFTELKVPPTSRTSPLCVEGGVTMDLAQVSISGYYTAKDEEPVDPAIMRSVDNKWYSNVQLNPTANTDLTFTFQNGVEVEQRSVSWITTNALVDDDFMIRLGDSLLLDAAPEGQTTGAVQIAVDGNMYTTSVGTPIVHKFETTGQTVVTATWTSDGGSETITDTLTVNVVGSDFSSSPSCFEKIPRSWDNSEIADEAVLESGTNLSLTESVLTPAGRTLDLYMPNVGSSQIIARLGEAGPIMDSVQVTAMSYSNSNDYYYSIIHRYEDGSVLMEGTISLSEVPDDLELTIRIYIAGVFFEDGTTEKTFTAADFDEFGTLTYRIVRSAENGNATCHYFEFEQNGQIILNETKNSSMRDLEE